MTIDNIFTVHPDGQLTIHFFCRLRRSIIISHMADNSSHFFFTPKINHRETFAANALCN